MLVSKEEISICKEVLKKFVYIIRTNSVCQLVFHYYNDSERDNFKTYPVGTKDYYASFNFDRTKRQIRKKILSTKNNYWKIEDSKIKIIENICTNASEEFDSNFQEYIEFLWNCSLEEQIKDFEREKREAEEKDNIKLKEILKDKYNLYKEVIILILNDTLEYPYKSDKIKVLLELQLDVETIFKLLQIKEKWSSPRGYINKYSEERKQEIKEKKIVIYELNSTIKHIINQLGGGHN